MIEIGKVIIENHPDDTQEGLAMVLRGVVTFTDESSIGIFLSQLAQVFVNGGYTNLYLTIRECNDVRFNNKVLKAVVLEDSNTMTAIVNILKSTNEQPIVTNEVSEGDIKSCPRCFSEDIEPIDNTDNEYMCYGCLKPFKI